MGKVKYILDFVNKGKEFNMPDWTVEKHESMLKKMEKHEDLLDNNPLEYERISRKMIILETLQGLDEAVEESDLDHLHPDDFLELFQAVYFCGKKGIIADFQKGKKKSKKPTP